MNCGAVQEKNKFEAVESSFAISSEVGGSGLVRIVAPLPAGDAAELPTTFVAIKLAQI